MPNLGDHNNAYVLRRSGIRITFLVQPNAQFKNMISEYETVKKQGEGF